MARKRLLGVFAHPDDETFGSGSVLAKYAQEGADVSVVCTTRGEVGEIAPGSEATRDTLGDVREEELRRAAEVLGVKSVILLGYRDSGMAGSEDNRHPQAFINAPEEEVVRRLAEIMRRLRPHVVMTMDEAGGYGHPDHIKASEWTTKAFKLSGDEGYRMEGTRPWRPSKLYYWSIRRSVLRRWAEEMRRRSPDSGLVRLDPESMGVADERFTTELDASPYVGLRMKAALEHRSQGSPFDGMPEELTREFLRVDMLIRVFPP
ncbi:MAG: GlcNAc-PI de-N-acetylase [SAR202 cluster bacterium]|nr:GlcNAc-PI de-N-acetylase [SAR202 cluster bacterium]